MTEETPAEKRARRKAQRIRNQAWYAELFRELPDGFTPVEAVTVVKALDRDGEVCLWTGKTAGLAIWDAYGMLAFAQDDYSPAYADRNSNEDDE